MVLNVDRTGLPEHANPKHCLALVCALSTLQSHVRRAKVFNVESICSLHLICSQSPDLRRICLLPRVPLDPESIVVVIFLERMHDVVFAYEGLRMNNLEMSDSGNDHYQALRAWCGAERIAEDTVLRIFGEAYTRTNLIRLAAERLGIEKFSDAQERILNEVDGAVEVISCVAGAGKTLILQAILLWVYYLITHDQMKDIRIT